MQISRTSVIQCRKESRPAEDGCNMNNYLLCDVAFQCTGIVNGAFVSSHVNIEYLNDRRRSMFTC